MDKSRRRVEASQLLYRRAPDGLQELHAYAGTVKIPVDASADRRLFC